MHGRSNSETPLAEIEDTIHPLHMHDQLNDHHMISEKVWNQVGDNSQKQNASDSDLNGSGSNLYRLGNSTMKS